MNQLVRLALLPFTVAAALTVVRYLICVEPARLFNAFICPSVAFDRIAVVAAAIAAALDFWGGGSAGFNAGVAIAISRSSDASVYHTANLSAAFVILRFLMLALHYLQFRSTAQLAGWSCAVCTAALFGIVTCPDAALLSVILSEPY